MDHESSPSPDLERPEAVDIGALAAEVAALWDRLAVTEAELAALRSTATPPSPAPTSSPTPATATATGDTGGDIREPAHGDEGPVGRRHVMKAGLAAAGAAAAAAGAMLFDAQPVAAANGSSLTIGEYNTGTAGTRLNITSESLTNGITILDHENVNALNSGLYIQARSQAFEIGASINSLYGTAVNASSGTGTGVRASANSGTALNAMSTSGPGASISSKQYQLLLALPTATRPAPTADVIQHKIGEIVRDAVGDLWLCTLTGTPGTWRKLGGPATAGALHLLDAPVRVYDSRPGTPPSVGSKTKLAPSESRAVDLRANSSGVPADALGVVCNVLLLEAANANGNFTIWANGKPIPQANTLVWGGSSGRFSTLALTKVDATGKAQVRSSLATHLALDVVGYYR